MDSPPTEDLKKKHLFYCSKCGKEYNFRSSYYKHVRKCQGKNYLCKEENCNFSAKSYIQLIYHLKRVHGTEVPLRQRNFKKVPDPIIKSTPTEDQHSKHVNMCQVQMNQEIKTKSNFSCREENCNFSAKLYIELIYHLKVVHEIEVPLRQQSFKNYSVLDPSKNSPPTGDIQNKLVRKCQEKTSQDCKNRPDYVCSEENCNFSAKLYIELNYHLKRVHKRELPLHHQNVKRNTNKKTRSKPTGGKEKKICSMCDREFKVRSSYYKHIKKCQGISNQDQQSSARSKPHYKCKEENCTFSAKLSVELIQHLKTEHEKEVPFHSQHFVSYSEFKVWKNNLEKETKSCFIHRNTRKNRNGRVEYFYCNRSGIYESKSSGKRLPKSKGLCKIGFGCLASIKAIVDNTDKVSATFCLFHYGHDKELSHIRLSKEDKNFVAQQLLLGISHHEILRNNFNGNREKAERRHLMNKQDVINLSRKYGFKSYQKHTDAHSSEELCFKHSIDDKSIILFKRQGEEHVYHPEEIVNTLGKNDFALAIMTDFQKSMLKKFGNHIVCLDSSNKRNCYKVNLITLLVIDEFQEGVPIGWLISNSENFAALRLFFEAIQREVGNISPEIFMSDNVPQYYGNWIHVFGGDIKHIICHWHVHHEWKTQLKNLKENDTAKTLFEGLCLLLEERNAGKFEEMLSQCIENLENNPDTQSFGEYFKREWVDNKKLWATCYRLNSTINTNTYLEAFSNALKYTDEYFKRKQERKLDKWLEVLLEFSKDLSTKRLAKLEKGKTNKEMSEICKRHQNSLLLPSELVFKTSEQTWEVNNCILAETTDFDCLKYRVTRNSKCELNCQVKCLKCNICVHSYSCDCPDGLTSSTICEHIHLILRCSQLDPLEPDVDFNCYKDSIPNTAEDNPIEYMVISINPDHLTDLRSIKDDLMKKYSELKGKIEACHDRDLLISARQHINHVSNILDFIE